MKRDHIFLALRSDENKEDTKNCGNIMNFYGETKSGSGKKVCNTKTDPLPSDNQVEHSRHRSITNEVEEGEEEVE